MSREFDADEISEALSATGSYDEDKASQQRSDLRESFRSGALKVERTAWAYLLIFTAVGGYCAARLIFADDPRDAILFGVVLFVMVLNQRATTLWYWVMNVKISILKELKLLRLSMASVTMTEGASEKRDIEQLLRKPLAHGIESTKLETRLRYAVLVAVGIACGMLGVNHAQRKARLAAMSAKELSTWYFSSADTVTAVSRIWIDESSSPASELDLVLPYRDGTIESATLNGVPTSVKATGEGAYRLTIPGELVMEDLELTVRWVFQRSSLELVDDGYRTVLRAMVPVKSYTLNVVIEDASTYRLDRWLSTGKGTPFSGSYPSPKQDLGSCGLGVMPR